MEPAIKRQESARQKLYYCDRASTVPFYRSLSLHMNNYAPLMIVKNALVVARSR